MKTRFAQKLIEKKGETFWKRITILYFCEPQF